MRRYKGKDAWKVIGDKLHQWLLGNQHLDKQGGGKSDKSQQLTKTQVSSVEGLEEFLAKLDYSIVSEII